MSSAVKTGLVIVGVGAAVYVVAKLVAPSPRVGAAPKVNNGWDIGGLISGASSIAGSIGDWFKPTTSTTEGIDPTTGGVTLAPGQTYGP